MDHGKTTLLDYLQQSDIQKQEFGGTTQLIRANSMKLHYVDDSGNPAIYPCTFLDTPGQSCFADVLFSSLHAFSSCSCVKTEVFSQILPSTLSLFTKVQPKKHIAFSSNSNPMELPSYSCLPSEIWSQKSERMLSRNQ